ncbi:MAG TPA: DNA polymerase I [Candidatus Deferrimicrobium sp.]|nr:DNA polymerase I [Candidatus Deferrimicrobium sp.]
MSAPRKTLYLIDGSAMFYRAYFAFIRNPLTNSKGENTSATFGFVNSLLKIMREEKPDYMAVAFDTRHPTFRHVAYSEYKSTRAKMPDELVDQLPRIRQAVDALGIPSFELEGYEADDIIGTIARKAESAGMDVWCVTGDKDYFQLVDDRVRIYNPKPGSEAPEKMGREEVRTKFGVPPEQVIDKLALMGDTSDNVPGIAGIGPKTAQSLLEEFGSLESVLSNYESIKAKGTKEKVRAGIDSARLSKELVTIRTDVPIDFYLDTLQQHTVNKQAVRELFLEMEFSSLLKQILPEGESQGVAEMAVSSAAALYKTVTSIDELKRLVAQLSACKEIAVDTETTSINALEARLVGVSLTDRAGCGYYVPLQHTKLAGVNLPYDEALRELKTLLENPRVQKIGQNVKYDLEVLHNCGIDIEPVSFDTMLASYVLNPSQRQHSLDFLALKHFDYRMQPISELIGAGKKQTTFDTVPIDMATFYAAEDADYTFRLRGVLAPMIHSLGLHDLYYNVELPLIKVLASMEEAGVRIDPEYLAELSVEMDKQLHSLEKEIYAVAGGEFNINSTQQLSHILFEKLSLPTKGKTAKKTAYSTDVTVLEELAQLHPFPKLILDYRQLTKLKGTYVDALPKLISPKTGRVHTSFNQTIAATGRLSSTDPNLQNIPVRTEEGRQIRKAFIPRDADHHLLVADYSQIELRILAHYSEDKGLIEAFQKGEDIHTRTAAEVFGVTVEDVTSQMRRAAKTANFAVIYGVTAYGLSQQTELDVDGARQFIDTYFQRYPGIREYIERTKQLARDNGYVTTLFNRRRYIPEINDKNFAVRQFAERTAINTPIQGTAADMIKVAMIRIHKSMSKMRSRMILQVHDELVFDAHKEELDKLKTLVRTNMEKAMKLKVPIVVDLGVGENWLEAK